MAKQEKFRRSAQSIGFKPIQVSGSEIANMRAESNRIASSMRDARNAEISERQRQLDAMKEGQQIEASRRKINTTIITQNAQKEADNLRLEADTRRKQLEINQEAASEMFKSIANLSKTAVEKVQEIDEARFEEDRIRAFELARAGLLTPEMINQIQGEAELQAVEQERLGQIQEAEATGRIDSLTASKLKSMSSGTRLGLEQGTGVYKLTEVYKQQLQKALAENPGMSSEETAQFMTKFYRDFLVNPENAVNGKPLIDIKPELLRVGTAAVQQLHQGIQTKARAQEEKELAEMRWDDAQTILTQNPAQFSDNVQTSFQTWKSDYGNKVALKQYESLATMRKPNGEFMFTMEQLGSADLKGNGKAFANEWPSRFADMKEARSTADTQQRTAEMQADNLAYREAEQLALERLRNNPSQAAADEAVKTFKDTYGKVPSSITKFQASYTLEAEAKARQIEKLESIPDGFITQEAVDALSFLDPTAANNLQKRFANQKRKYTTGTFKAQSDSFKNVANGVTTLGTAKPNNPSSVFLQEQMRAEYRRRVDEAVAGGADFNTAANTIGMQLAQEVKDGARDPDSKWYRKATKAGGGADFPNLNTGNVSKVEQARRNYQALQKRISDDGLEKTLDTAESIITAAEATAIIQQYGKPGFVIPTDVLAVAGMTNGLDPFTIINRQLKALNLVELPVPTLTQTINEELSPELRQQLYSDIAGPQQRLRALRQASGNFNDGGNLRSSFSGVNGTPSNNDPFIVAIGINEGTRTAGGGTTSAYRGHTDPGDGKRNRGTFSYAPERFGTDPNMSPEEADAAYMTNLTAANNKYAPILKQLGYQEGTQDYAIAMFNILDLTVQAPAAVNDFVNIGLKNLAGMPLNATNIGDARAYAFYNPQTGRLEASGFGNNFERLRADQKARSMTIINNRRN